MSLHIEVECPDQGLQGGEVFASWYQKLLISSPSLFLFFLHNNLLDCQAVCNYDSSPTLVPAMLQVEALLFNPFVLTRKFHLYYQFFHIQHQIGNLAQV
jgi:hypothetical protein